MTKFTRRIIFYSLLLIFVISAPLAILYSSGYFYDWQNKKIIETGAFSIDSQPKGANVFINGQIKSATPKARIRYLVTGSYEVEVAKDGFFPWKKTLEIQPSLVTEAINIFLVPTSPKTELVAQSAASTLKYYFLTPAQKIINDQASSTMSKIIKDASAWTIFENNIYYLQKSNLILFKTAIDGSLKKQISLSSLPEYKSLASTTPLKNYQIRQTNNQTAIFAPDDKLYLLNPATKLFEPLAEGILGAEFCLDGKKLLYWNNHEIWVLWLTDILIQPQRKAGDKELITRFANKITQAIWLTQTNEHIIYIVEQADKTEKIKITELDGRDLRNTADIYTGQDIEIYWDSETELLYTKTGKKLYSIDLTSA